MLFFLIAAIVLTIQTIYSGVFSNFNFGVVILSLMSTFFWAAFLLQRFWPAVLITLPGRICAGVFAFGWGLFFILLTFVAVSGYTNKPKGDEKALIVLGAALHGSKVSRVLAYRLDKAYEYYLENPDTVIITTGGQGRQEDLPEGRAMREYLIQKGVPENQIFAEEKSTSTEENFLFCRKILENNGIQSGEPIAFVTNAFHCYRATKYAQMAGYEDIRALPAGISIGAIMPCYFREVFALLYFWGFKSSRSGWISGLVGLLKVDALIRKLK